MSQKFRDCLKEVADLHAKKGADYGTNTDPFANVRASEEFNIPAWQGAVLRANDKMSRLKTYCVKGTLANEGVEDSLLDLATYALIGLVLFREKGAARDEMVKEIQRHEEANRRLNAEAAKISRQGVGTFYGDTGL